MGEGSGWWFRGCRIQWVKDALSTVYIWLSIAIFTNGKYKRHFLNTHAYSNHSQILWGCCIKLFSLQHWKIKHGFPGMTTAESNAEHVAHPGLFLESVNNRCLTRKRIPSVTLSNGGLALFLKHKKENTTKTQKLPQMKQTAQRPFSQNKKFLSGSKTFSVWYWVWGQCSAEHYSKIFSGADYTPLLY